MRSKQITKFGLDLETNGKEIFMNVWLYVIMWMRSKQLSKFGLDLEIFSK